jgi:hypothetical protein
MSMNVKYYGKLNEDELAKFEKVINFNLPMDYRKFLIEHNGCIFEEHSEQTVYLNVSKLEQRIPIDILLGIHSKKHIDLRSWNDEYNCSLLPSSIIIGLDPGTGFVTLLCDPANAGVYYWDHSLNFNQSTEESNTYKIANSFTEFLDNLTVEENK